MNYFNLLGNIGPIEEQEEETEEELEYEITTMIMCGCKQHFIDSRKDPYKEHNKWVEGKKGYGVEDGKSHLQGVKEKKRFVRMKQAYDFSGEEFEVTSDELRKHKK
jgi:hypothetical protein